MLESKPIGVLGFFSRGSMRVESESQRLLSALGSQVGQFIERWRTAEGLRASEATLQLLLRQLPLAVWTVDLRLNIQYCAGKLDPFEGPPSAQAHPGTSIAAWFPSGHEGAEVHRQAMAGKPGRFDFDQGEKAFTCYVEPLRDREGTIAGAIGAAIEVTGLRREQEKERRHKVELERRVDQRSKELQAALREINAISHTIAHDLRGPLRAIASGAQIILEDNKRLGDEARQWAERIVGAANRMDSLVLGLLEYSRLAWQNLAPQTVELGAVVREVLLQMNRQIGERQARIAIDESLPSVRGHPLALAQALGHLLSNAMTFMPAGVLPKIRNYAERRGSAAPARTGEQGSVLLWVEDNGIGIAPEHQERIFGVFERLHRRESYPGTGIGLAITRRLVERMGGKVGVRSELGTGSSFFLELPGA